MSNPGQIAPPPLADLVVIDDPIPHPAALNMALDEVLLAGLGEAAVLRCYRWSEAAVSFGCFGHAAEVRRNYSGYSLVRRWTGGGLVEHGSDFTFTLLVPRQSPLATVTARESYRLIHGAVASALIRTGLEGVELAASAFDEPSPTTREAPFLNPCFTRPVADDLMVAGHKIAGGAQRRAKSGLLHQGSIQGIKGIDSRGDPFRALLGANLAIALAIRVASRPVSPSELELADELVAKKYGVPTWTNRF